jgi:hypothetical protein
MRQFFAGITSLITCELASELNVEAGMFEKLLLCHHIPSNLSNKISKTPSLFEKIKELYHYYVKQPVKCTPLIMVELIMVELMYFSSPAGFN